MLSAPQVHLFTNHIPIMGIPFILALLLYGLWRKREDIQRISMASLVIVGLLSVPAFLSGEGAEEAIEDQPGISEVLVEHHEDAANLAFWFLEVLAASALISLAVFRRPKALPTWIGLTVVIGLIVCGTLLVRAGHLGGKISHPEIRVEQAGTIAPGRTTDNDDD